MKPGPFSFRQRRKFWIAAIALTVFTVVGFFVLPPVLKSQLEKRASIILGRAVTVGRVRVNPYTLSATLEDFDIRLKDGNGSFLGWKRLYVNFDALASLTGDWVLSEIELEGFHTTVMIGRDGVLSFSDILARLNPPGPAATPPPSSKPGRPWRIGSLKVAQARVEFSDESRAQPFATVAGPVSFALTEFRTAGAQGAPCHFEAVTESGEKLAWTGTINAEQLRSVGEFSLQNIVLAKYSPYYANQMQADLVAGKLSMRGRYEIDLMAGRRALKLSDGALHVRDLKVLERASQEVAVELAALDISGIDADALAPKATVAAVTLAGGHLRVRREKEGAINLLAMLQPPPATSGATLKPPVAGPGKLPEIMIGEVALQQFQVDFKDLAAPSPAELALSDLRFSLKKVTLADGAIMPLELSLNWKPQGGVKMIGNISLKPLKADLKLQVADLEIRPLTPYLEQFLDARITQGLFTTTLAAQVALLEGQPPEATLAGEVKIEKFGLVDGAQNEELAGFGALGLAGLRVSTGSRLSVTVAEVGVVAPYARIVRSRDGGLNLAAVVRPAAPAGVGTARPPATATTAAPQIEIGKVVITGGDFGFVDRSIEPNVRLAINRFAGSISALSSENLAKADVDLKATVDGVGPVAITGQLDPLGVKKFVDLKIDFRNVDLQPLSPYSGKYAGYELARGKLELEVKVSVDGKKIDATDLITLNQFTFGAPVKSPDDLGLPVRLGVALLKDLDGRIFINVPVQGSLDDPDFHLGKIVWRVVLNLLTKAAVSPFSLLGSMFGGGGDELGFQEFAPGTAALQPGEIKKLETMVKALTNRPGLSLDLEGSYDGPADSYVLQRQKFAGVVRRAIWEQKHALTPTIPPPEQLVITPEENAAMVKQLFDAKFPAGTKFGAPLAQAPVAVAPPPPARKNFFGRVVDLVTLKTLRSEKQKTAEAAKPAEVKPAAGVASTGPSVDEMSGRMAETIVVGDDDLRALAAARAQQVRDYFITVGKIDPERLFLAKDQTDTAKAGKGSRVLLNLQ